MPRPTILLPPQSVSNGDEARAFGPDGQFRYIGNFHKTLPHDPDGIVDAAAYASFAAAAADARPGPPSPTYETIPEGSVPPGTVPSGMTVAAPFVSPLSGRALESLGPDPFALHLWPAPPVCSDSTAAEMTEVFWMALWRDVSLDQLHSREPGVMAAIEGALDELRTAFRRGIAQDGDAGVRLGLDLPVDAAGALDLRAQTLFRSGFPDEDKGPLVSQFFLHDVPFGTQAISQKQFPYAAGRDYLQRFDDWLMAQNIGRDAHGKPYPDANDFADSPAAYEAKDVRRTIGSMRDLARFVHKDALHQAYFNAALLLESWKAPTDPGNPYRSTLKRQAGFATLGGPNLLTMVSEVASRALKVVWRQKWMVHRRLRPEAYGGLMTVQHVRGKPLGLPEWVFNTKAAQAIRDRNRAATQEDNFLLPMAFTSGSPAHPAYGAGHATVAGACVTVLKAWYDEKEPIRPLVERGRHPETRAAGKLLRPQVTTGPLAEYTGSDRDEMTVGGELNKIASNVAMGRTMGGVHWRTDNTRSLRMGEAIATVIMKRQVKEYAEPGVRLSYCSFDGHDVFIETSGVRVPSDPALEAFYATL